MPQNYSKTIAPISDSTMDLANLTNFGFDFL